MRAPNPSAARATAGESENAAISELEHALARLMSLSNGDHSVLRVGAIGDRTVPQLRVLLFRRQTSGLFEPRCRVAEPLAALDARDSLAECLTADRDIADDT